MPKGDGKIKKGDKGPPQLPCPHCGDPHGQPCPSPDEIIERSARIQDGWSPMVERYHRGLGFRKGFVEIEEIAFDQIHGNRVYRAPPD